MKNILCTTSSFGSCSAQAVARLEEQGFKPIFNPHGRKLTEKELMALLDEHRPVGLLAGTEPVTGAVLEQAREYLTAVSRVGVGWDNVDHDKAKELGIPVHRTEGVLDQCVAELAVGLMLAALRDIAFQDRSMREGTWKKHMGGMLGGRTVGIIGFGAIGRRLGELLHAFGCTIIWSDPYCTQCPSWGRQCTGMDELLAEADIVSIHASGDTALLDSENLSKLKTGTILVNTARGGMIDEQALLPLLKSGKVGYACLDVFAEEPYKGPLLEMPNTVLTPHVGSYAHEARARMEELAVENLLKALGEVSS